MGLREKIYNALVRKNENVQREYERYVIEHIEEHYENRLKHWKILWKLNWHYRIKKKTEAMLYFDSVNDKKPISQVGGKKEENNNKKPLPSIEQPESYCSNQIPPHQFVKRLLQYDTISFDVFDTLILRSIADMKGVYTLVGEKLDYLSFQRIRIRAQAEARERTIKKCNSNEMFLEDIYKVIEEKTDIPYRVGMQVEMDVEKKVCFANPYMKRVFEILLSFGKRIVIVSDMYMSRSQIEELLHSCGYEGFSEVYVSSEYKCNKAQGKLYNVLLEKEGIKNSIIHVGDNLVSDIQRAKEKGIATAHYTNVNSAGNKYRCDGMSQLIRWAYRGIVNSTLHSGVKRYSIPYECGFIYGGIYILGMARWVHEYAKLHQLDKILFLARDGYVYKKVYDMMFDDIDSEYVYWSRQANMKYAAIYQKEQFILRNINHKVGKGISIKEILCEAKIEFLIEDFEDLCIDTDEKLTFKNKDIVEKIIIKRWQDIVTTYENEKKAVEQYFKTIIGTSKKIAIVEVGWVGTSQDGLKKLIENEWIQECEVYCLNASNAATDPGENIVQVLTECYSSYLFSFVNNSSIAGVHRDKNGSKKTMLFELFTQANHPSFRGFRINEAGDLQMEFDMAEVENYDFFEQIMEGEIDFCQKYIECFKEFPILLNIPGYDAYMPFRTMTRNFQYAKKNLGDIQIAETVGLNGTEGEMKALKNIL